MADLPDTPAQLAFDFDAPVREARAPVREKPRLRLVKGGGERKQEKLGSRDAVARVLMEAGADLLLRRISSARAEEIERRVDHILSLFDRVDRDPAQMPKLSAALEELEALMTETRAVRARR